MTDTRPATSDLDWARGAPLNGVNTIEAARLMLRLLRGELDRRDAAAGLLDPDARLREAVAALRAKTDPRGGVPWLEPELSSVFAALDAAPTPDPPEYVAALEKVADLARSYFRVRPGRIAVEIRSALAALDAVPAETGEQLAARLTDRMRARDTAGSGEACDWSPTGTHEPGMGRDRAECRHCDAPVS